MDFVTNYIREIIFDPMVLEENVQKILHDYDIKDIPIYENQEGYWRDLEMIESLWKLPVTSHHQLAIAMLPKSEKSAQRIHFCNEELSLTETTEPFPFYFTSAAFNAC